MLSQNQAASLSVACLLFSRFFGHAPDEEIWQEFSDIRHMGWVNEAACQDELDVFNNFQQSLNEDLQDVILDYNQLFVGPSELKAPPWASLYLSEKKHVFSEETLKVKSFYKKYQMKGVHANEAADHIALELRFISLLLCHFEQADEASRLYILRDLTLFLRHHFFPWVSLKEGMFLYNMEQYAQTQFYKNIGRLLIFTLYRLEDMGKDE